MKSNHISVLRVLYIFLFIGLLVLALGPGPVFAEMQIDSIQINQVIGVQKDNNLKFVAGKSTAVRALLNEGATVDAAQTNAVIKKDGATVATLAPNAYTQTTNIVDFLCPSLSACGNWAAGSYSFEVMVNGKTKDTTGSTYQFQDRAEVSILALPVKANYKGTVTQVSDNKWKTMWQFTQRTYPLADEKIKWHMREELDASDSKYDLETSDGQRALWEALTSLNPSTCSTSPTDDGCYALIVGFISDRPGGYPNGNLQGYTYGRPTNIVVAKDEDAEATVAHEIAHVYGIGDTYAGGSLRCSVNPSPDGFKGSDWDNRENSDFSCSSGKTALENVSATLIPASVYPYEVGGRGGLGDMACFMGSGGKQEQFWVTPETYDWLFDKLAPVNKAAMSMARRASGVSQRFIHFEGFINDKNEVSLEPWKTVTETLSVSDTTGNLMIRAVDANGTTLASRALEVQFYVLSTPPAPTKKVDWAPFEGLMLFPATASKFQIVKNGTVLSEVNVSKNAPAVTDLVVPSASTDMNAAFLISWTGSDLDIDKLTYTVEYNPDVTKSQSVWTILEDGLELSSWSENFGNLPGGAHAKIRVTATDGVLSATTESAEFTVPVKTPEVFIEPLIAGDSYTAGRHIPLEAEAYDLQDEWISDNNIKWSSDLSGQLGTGSKIVAKGLTAGNHTITVTATSSSGQTATDSTKVTVADNKCMASISSGLVVSIPIVTFNGSNYWVSLQYNASSSTLTVAGAGAVSDAGTYSSCTASTLSSDFKLHIPVLMFGGSSYWLDLQYNGSAFNITGFGAN